MANEEAKKVIYGIFQAHFKLQNTSFWINLGLLIWTIALLYVKVTLCPNLNACHNPEEGEYVIYLLFLAAPTQ